MPRAEHGLSLTGGGPELIKGGLLANAATGELRLERGPHINGSRGIGEGRESPERVRVLLVGRTGLDGALRLDTDLELIRVVSALDAIGELANPLDLDSPAHAVVVLSPEAHAEVAHERGTSAGLGREADYLNALRRVDPTVRVVVSRRGTPGEPEAVALTPGLYDGVLQATDAAPRVRAEIRDVVFSRRGEAVPASTTPPTAAAATGNEPSDPQRAPERMPERAQRSVPGAHAARPEPTRSEPSRSEPTRSEPVQPQVRDAAAAPDRGHLDELDTVSNLDPLDAMPLPESPEPASSSPVLSESAAPIGDAVLVDLLTRGKDPIPAAIALLRERLNDPSVLLVLAGSQTPGQRVRVDQGHALVAASTSEAVLSSHARWLASWIALKQHYATLRNAAYTDPLTGAWNRRYCDRFLAKAIDEARKARRHVSVMIFDIDNFKMYNDRYGHDAGDEILCEAVRLLGSMIRPSDRVCRIGGDEFAVVFYEPHGPRQEGSRHPDSVFAIARRFQQQIAQHRFPKLGTQAPGSLTISGGLATFPWDGATATDLLCRADALAMASKRAGKGALTFGPPGGV
jgi:diguanylate cyclase (GGDEF)-like protein